MKKIAFPCSNIKEKSIDFIKRCKDPAKRSSIGLAQRNINCKLLLKQDYKMGICGSEEIKDDKRGERNIDDVCMDHFMRPLEDFLQFKISVKTCLQL